MLGHYRCRKCKYTWKEKTGPVTCPKCEHIFIDWLNWEKVINKRKKTR